MSRPRSIVLGTSVALLGIGFGWFHSRHGPPRPRFPNLTLQTHDGRTVKLYDDLVRGDRIVAITFMSARGDAARPRITENLLEVQRALRARMGRDVVFYSITLEPEHDTPEVLRDYAECHEVGPGWTFLTGKKETIEELGRDLGLSDPDPAAGRDKAQLAGVILFGNDALHSWSVCPGRTNPAEIVKRFLGMESPAMRSAARKLEPAAAGP